MPVAPPRTRRSSRRIGRIRLLTWRGLALFPVALLLALGAGSPFAPIVAGAALTGSLVTEPPLSDTVPNAADLTAVGNLDWAIWGFAEGGTSTSLAPDVRKAGGSAISALTDIQAPGGCLGGESPCPLRGIGQFPDEAAWTFSWSDGGAVPAAEGAFGGIQHNGYDPETETGDSTVGDGFSFTVPAGVATQRLTLFGHAHGGAATITATLSDESAPPWIGSFGVGGHATPGMATIDFAAASEGQTLTVSIVQTSIVGGANAVSNNAALHAVALEGSNVDAPSLFQATPTSGGTAIAGHVNGPAGTELDVTVSTGGSCATAANDGSVLGTIPVTIGEDGFGYFSGTLEGGASSHVVAQVTGPTGFFSDVSECIAVAPDNDAWTRALTIGSSGSGFVDAEGRARWFRFPVTPGGRVSVTLDDLAADYDLFLFKDIAQAYTDLTTPEDLNRLSAEFAPSVFSPSVFSPSVFSPSVFSPDAYSPSVFSPSVFSPSVFSPSVFSPSVFSPSVFSPSVFSPSVFSPSVFSPSVFSPSVFSPSVFSPDGLAPSVFSPESFASAQTRSLIAVSANTGTGAESVVADTWNNTGYFYVRVSGKNGAFDADEPFSLTVQSDNDLCGGVGPVTGTPSVVAGDYRTIILVDPERMAGDSVADRAALLARLDTLKARPEVDGVVVDVGASSRIDALNEQADDDPTCVYAKNLVADGIKDIVDAYRAASPNLEYVVIVGGDDVIPFFRYPDQSLLGPESDFVPPVDRTSASEASLRLNYVLGQDAYGAGTEISLRASTFPIPDLAVGRLVETAAEATAMVDAYLTLPGGVTAAPSSSLVTGYDFLEDAANKVRDELADGTGAPVDTLIAPNNISPTDPAAWTADDLRDALLSERHDLVYLAGHFSANSALAADFATSFLTTELTGSSVDLTNSIVFSAGCHSGYNIVDGDAIPNVTQVLDWPQAFAQKRATLVAGTGYQYGDTDFIEYSERIYGELAHQLRVGSGPVSIGEALVRSKQIYLETTPDIRGLHEKALLEATVFGLPMLSVDMPGDRDTTTGDGSIVGGTSPYEIDPGAALDLRSADVSIDESLSERTVSLTNLEGGTLDAKYLEGPNGVVTNPAEPAVPLIAKDVSVSGQFLRGVGFRGGAYTDSTVVPLTGAPTTELRGVHTPFVSSAFYPMRLATPNYFDALANGGATNLLVTPVQHRAVVLGDPNVTRRVFDDVDLRLFYSSSITNAALSEAPTITGVTAEVDGTTVTFQARVAGDPAAGVAEVWVTYTGHASAWASLDLSQDPFDSTLWSGTLNLSSGVDADDLAFMVQAVNGVGLVSTSDNFGQYFPVGVAGAPIPQPVATTLTLDATPTTATFGDSITVGATLSPAVAGKPITFSVGGSARVGITDSAGRATASLPVTALPASYALGASFAGDATHLPSSASRTFSVTRTPTTVTLTGPASATQVGTDRQFAATVVDDNGVPLILRAVAFVVTAPDGTRSVEIATTDFLGTARLTLPGTPVGIWQVLASFGESIALPAGGGPLDLTDPTHAGSHASVSAQVIWPFTGFLTPIDNLPTVNTVKAGSSVPVKFQLGGDRGLSIVAAGYPKAVAVTCSSGAPTDAIEEISTSGASGLQYDAATQTYTWTWKTPKTYKGKCYNLEVKLVDGTTHVAAFRFT